MESTGSDIQMTSIFGYTSINSKSRREDAIKKFKQIKQLIEVTKKLNATVEIARYLAESYSDEYISIEPSTKTANAIRIELRMKGDGTLIGETDETEIDNAITRITKDIEIEKANYELIEKIEKEMDHVEDTTE
jgi:hypothetical protein